MGRGVDLLALLVKRSLALSGAQYFLRATRGWMVACPGAVSQTRQAQVCNSLRNSLGRVDLLNPIVQSRKYDHASLKTQLLLMCTQEDRAARLSQRVNGDFLLTFVCHVCPWCALKSGSIGQREARWKIMEELLFTNFMFSAPWEKTTNHLVLPLGRP